MRQQWPLAPSPSPLSTQARFARTLANVHRPRGGPGAKGARPPLPRPGAWAGPHWPQPQSPRPRLGVSKGASRSYQRPSYPTFEGFFYGHRPSRVYAGYVRSAPTMQMTSATPPHWGAGLAASCSDSPQAPRLSVGLRRAYGHFGPNYLYWQAPVDIVSGAQPICTPSIRVQTPTRLSRVWPTPAYTHYTLRGRITVDPAVARLGPRWGAHLPAPRYYYRCGVPHFSQNVDLNWGFLSRGRTTPYSIFFRLGIDR